MRILDAYHPPSTSTDAAASRPVDVVAQGTTAATAATSADSPPVTVTVSDKARELSSVASDASSAKVARLQGAIASGTFNVDPQAIATRILQGD